MNTKFLKLQLLIWFFTSLFFNTKVQAQYSFTYLENVVVKVISPNTNIYSAPNLESYILDTKQKDDILNVIGEYTNWYIVQLKDNSIGLIHKDYVASLDPENTKLISLDNETIENIFNSINSLREENNTQYINYDEKLSLIAQKKAIDMATNEYINHFSETYKTPFKMLKDNNIDFKFATESFMVINNDSDILDIIKNNKFINVISLNKNFNKIGIGLSKNYKSEKVIVQIFINETQ